MKVIAIYGGYGDIHEPAKAIMDIACNTLKELQVEVEFIDLFQKNIPYYSHQTVPVMDDIFAKIQEAEAVILGSAVQYLGVSGTTQVFLDYSTDTGYRTALEDKYILSIAISSSWGEREAGEHMLRLMGLLGAQEVDKIVGKLPQLQDLDEDLKIAVEKRIEDFYRIIRQKRRNLPVSEGNGCQHITQEGPKPTKMQGMQPQGAVEPSKGAGEENTPSSDYMDFTDRQKADIEELAEIFKMQLGKKQENEGNIEDIQSVTYGRPVNREVIQPSKKTCQQMTASLPHYFQPHLATEFKAVFQMNISGEESFQMILDIDEQECTCEEGVAQQPDITIQADTEVWTNVLKGKVSVQKAFMIGQLKVRGNFMILNKLDQLFKKM